MEGGNFIVSIVENRAREVCISSMDTQNTSLLAIYLIGDNHSYSEVVKTLRELDPSEILIHDGCRSKILTRKVEHTFSEQEDVRIVFISRQYFDQGSRSVVSENTHQLPSSTLIQSNSLCLCLPRPRCRIVIKGRGWRCRF
jgi:hypothetical protein